MYTNALSVLALVGAAQAHMSMFYPPPLGGHPSINKQSTDVDKEFNFPLGCCGADSGGDTGPSPGLCRGHMDKFDTEEASVTWEAGQDAYFQLTDFDYDPDAPGSTHYGGSCQVGFSVDKGATWKVAASYHGACPYHTEDGSPEAQTFDFKVPSGMPSGDAVFAWVWLNREHEAFVNCAKVKIGAGSGGSTPSVPSKPSQSAIAPKPSQSGAAPKPSPKPQQPDDDEESTPSKPQYPEDEDEDEDEDEEEPSTPVVTPRPSATGRPGGRPSSVSTSRARPTPSVGDADEGADAGTDEGTDEGTEEDEDSEGDSEGDSEEDSDEDEESTESEKPWWASHRHREHREVKDGARRYNVDGHSCECRREPLNSRCYCDAPGASLETRAAVEKKALRMHRRTLYKRVDACDWASAPAMETSYYTSDAKCAPNAKSLTSGSDEFELGWDVSCGVVEGDGEYQIKMMDCNMFGA
jgi:hypothetical protein